MAHYYKYHALGNDYIVIDSNKTSIELTTDNIRLICHRNFGVGSDGILYGPFLKEGRLHFRIFNPDGSEAEKSGNGIRIFARYLIDTHYAGTNEFYLYPPGGEVKVEVMEGDAGLIKVDMGPVTFHSSRIPVAGAEREVVGEILRIGDQEFTVTCLSVGNPHCVIPLPEISPDMALTLGPLIENHALFPNRINVQFMKVLDRETIQIEIWERGAGYTLASGSSSCAAASAARKLGLVDDAVRVHMPGGIIHIETDAAGHVHMTGPVTPIAYGEFLPVFKEIVGMK
jgi:diaminopimelate epimerase